MKLKKALKKLNGYLERQQQQQLEQYDSIKKLLKKLKKKRNTLRKKIADAKDPDERRRLEKKLEVLTAQRRKGLNLVGALKKRR